MTYNPHWLTSGLSNRIAAIDILRGIVMVLMTLDHTRDFFSNLNYDPTDLAKTSTGLFLTRWITHYCAPVFIFLAGASAYLSAVHHSNKWLLSKFLLTRGLWIVFLGITFESLIWCFTPDFSEISGAVLWAIGWSMVALAGLIFLPLPMIAFFSFIMIAGHNLFDGLSQNDFGIIGPLWAILHSGESVTLGARMVFHPAYPLIPWIGVMAMGYCFGRLMLLPAKFRMKLLLILGNALILLFITLRYSNVYGDPKPWVYHDTPGFTLLSFINCKKYPPSLLYLLMTLGPAITLLPLLDKVAGRFGNVLVVFGQTPLFYYLAHLTVISALSVINASVISSVQFGSMSLEGFPQAFGYELPIVYLIWAGIVTALYPLCLWFRHLKRFGGHPLLKYL